MTLDLLERLAMGEELSTKSVDRLVDRLVDPARSDLDRAALLVAWRTKGESPGEVAAFAQALRRRARPFPGARDAIDLCGSGGAKRPSFNIGTVSAFVVRAAGVPVAKHGNRSARGARHGWAGSSDLLEALGLPYVTSLEFARATFDREKITFLHAPLFHPATRAVVPARTALGIRTVFNLAGPLTNPAAVRYQVVGCPDRETAARLASVLPRLGVVRGLTVSSEDGRDEFSPRSPSTVFSVGRARPQRTQIDPGRLLDPEDRRGDWGPLPAKRAAEETDRLLAGGGGARRGAILLTSGAALWARGRARTLREGVTLAREALDGGAAEALLGRLRAIARERSRPEVA